MSQEKEGLNIKQKELFIKKSTRVAASYLRKLESLSDTPDAMRPFLEILKNIYVDLQNVQCPEGMKTIGTYCVLVPIELVYAAGAIPVRLCSGSYTAYSIGDDYVPRDACPLIKAIMGFSHTHTSPIYENCSLMVIPVTCDCKKKVAGMLEQFKPTVILNVPPMKSVDADTEVYLQELYKLIPHLETATGKQITADTLAKSINDVGYAQYEMSRFLNYRQNEPALLHGAQVIAVMNSFAYMPVLKWAEQMHKLNQELEMRLNKQQFVGKTKQPRILITGSPIAFPNIKIPLLIEEMGGMLVADETCFGERGLYDPAVVIDESFDGMIRALTNRYMKPCTCPVFVDNNQRLYRIKQMIKINKVQGVIYHVLRGCLVYDYEYQMIEDTLGRMNIPVIRVESDYNEEDVEQLRIRIEAFIEMIKLKHCTNRKNGEQNG